MPRQRAETAAKPSAETEPAPELVPPPAGEGVFADRSDEVKGRDAPSGGEVVLFDRAKYRLDDEGHLGFLVRGDSLEDVPGPERKRLRALGATGSAEQLAAYREASELGRWEPQLLAVFDEDQLLALYAKTDPVASKRKFGSKAAIIRAILDRQV